jgi:hypothetical protein
MTIGTGDRSSRAVTVFRLCGQCSIGPRGVADQSKFRIRAVVSPSPCRKLVAGEDMERLTDSGRPLRLPNDAEAG